MGQKRLRREYDDEPEQEAKGGGIPLWAWAIGATLALLLLGGGRQARANYIVDQPLNVSTTGPQFGYFSDGVDSGSGGRQEIASGFSLSSDAVVVDVQWYGAYRFGNVPSNGVQFLIRFYSDANYLPGTLITQEVSHVTGAPTGLVNAGGLPILAYDTTIAPLSLNAGSIYWISILEDDASTAFANEWAWQFSDVGNVPAAGSGTDGLSWSGGPLQGPGANMAFILSDANVTATPEPASATLLGIGIVGLLGYAWRRRKQDKPLSPSPR